MNVFFRLIRINNWIKNIFLFFPLVFSLKLFNVESILHSIIGFFAFSFASSFIYIINDILDIENDKIHPRKQNRPLPSGQISIIRAIVIAFVLVVSSLLLAFHLHMLFFMIVAGYLLLNLAYNFYLKHVNLMDILSIALNFVLRILAGCYAIAVVPSNWIIVVTFFVSLVLIFIKRKSELKVLKDGYTKHRPVLKHYSKEILDKFIQISATITIFAYVMYTLDDVVVRVFKTDKLLYSTVFVVIGLFRFIQLSESERYNNEGDPTLLILKDRFIQLISFLWMVYVILILYFV
jgi:4-hydroxybenzoate polyprenyltransferase